MASDTIESVSGLVLPDNPSALIESRPELEDFLIKIVTPLGPISAEEAPNYVLCAEIMPHEEEVLKRLGEIATQPMQDQVTKYGVLVATYLTAMEYRVITVTPPHVVRGQNHGRAYSTLELPDESILLGFKHAYPGRAMKWRESNLPHSERVKIVLPGTLRPLDRISVHGLNLVASK
ncbi:MAG: hypothetical protein V4702_03750 [Patescibacteria group bacterium]